MTPQEMLRELEELEARADLIVADMEAKRAEILRPVAVALAELDDEYAPILSQAARMVADAKERLVEAVKHDGESVKGDRLQAIYIKGRESWDSRALAGYAAAHPEIAQFRKVGEPTVTIRARGENRG